MYSRLTTFELDPLCSDLDGAARRVGETAVATMSEEPGFDGAYVIVRPDGRGVVVSLWKSRRPGLRAALGLGRRRPPAPD